MKHIQRLVITSLFLFTFHLYARQVTELGEATYKVIQLPEIDLSLCPNFPEKTECLVPFNDSQRDSYFPSKEIRDNIEDRRNKGGLSRYFEGARLT